MSGYLHPKDFIRNIYIGNLNELVNKYQYFYISFGLMGTGIELLGKCINEEKNETWHEPKLGVLNFNMVLDELMPSYAPFKCTHSLCDCLRNGMAHAFQPKNKIELSNKSEAKDREWEHLKENKNQKLVLVCESIYEDFKTACEEVIRRVDNNEFNQNGKMYKSFLEV